MKPSLFTLSAFLFIGCTKQVTHPIQLENNQGNNISINILSKNKTDVPKDRFFNHKNWHYRQTKTHKYGYYFDNDEIVATFYLAHHATNIYIQGNSEIISKYKNYFFKNQVTSKIVLIPIKTDRRPGKIIIDYYQITKKDETKLNKIIRSGKNTFPPMSDVIEIPIL